MYRLEMGFHVCTTRISRTKLHLQLSSSLLALELHVIPGLLVTLGLWQRLCALYVGGSSLPCAVLLRFLCLETLVYLLFISHWNYHQGCAKLDATFPDKNPILERSSL